MCTKVHEGVWLRTAFMNGRTTSKRLPTTIKIEENNEESIFLDLELRGDAFKCKNCNKTLYFRILCGKNVFDMYGEGLDRFIHQILKLYYPYYRFLIQRNPVIIQDSNEVEAQGQPPLVAVPVEVLDPPTSSSKRMRQC